MVAIAAKIAAVVLIFDPEAATAFALPKSAVSLTSAVAMVGLITSYLLRFPDARSRMSPVHLAVAVFVLANLVATILAVDRSVAMFGADEHYLGLAALLDSVVLYAAVATFVRGEQELRRLVMTLGLVSVPVLTYAGVQGAGLDPIQWSAGSGISSTIGNRGPLGAYLMATGLALAAFLAVSSGLPPVWRVVGLGVITANLIGAVQVGARAPIAGLAAGAAALAVLSATRLPRLLTRPRTLGLLAVLAAAVLLTGAPAITRIPSALSASDASGRERIILWTSAAQLASERPVLGLGPDNFAVGYPRIRPGGDYAQLFGDREVLAVSTHTWPARMLTDAGVAGLVAYLVVLVAAAHRVLLRRTPMAVVGAVLLAGHLGQGLFGVDHVAIEWIPWLGLGLIGSNSRIGDARRVPRSLGQLGRVVSGASLALALLAAVALWQPVRASEALARSSQAIGRGDTIAALVAAREAVSLDPGRAANWHALGLAHEAAGDLRGSAAAYEEAARVRPYRADSWRALAIAHMNLGLRGDLVSLARAVEAAKNGVRAEPASPLSRYILSRALAAAGDDTGAVHEGEAAIALYPGRDAIESTARAYLRLGKPADAERLVLQRLPGMPDLELIAAEIALARGDVEGASILLDRYLDRHATDQRALDLRRRLE